MEKMIFVNLPVTDLSRSIAFYEAIGATADQHFRDDTAQMMKFSETICVMLLTHPRFSGFTSRKIPNAHETAQVLLCLTEESRADVDGTVAKAVSGGGAADPNPVQDHGFMYGRSFEDPDGHIWEVTWMDVEAAMAASAGAEASA
ncbi:VOC family protein [Sphingobium nicotianae]|uniref:Lactoylglutathione lyase n=1 Tax=Sphingobium nicotianae TaxID=2782607 RepID=A0A9X1DAZ6_9SPHN|nr:VOC family protein [Sphingobium nicotianae]MBT2186606.1 lactoylglutathione lyase [Sphingobium nicotianae]